MTILDDVLTTIRTRETSNAQAGSGPGYTSQNYGPYGASGAYQYILSTWQGWARRAGFGQYADRPAASAPASVQDAVAAANVKDILSGAHNNVAAVPLAWYTGDPNHAPTWDLSKPSDAAGYRANNGYQPWQYQRDWLATYNQVSGGKAPAVSSGGGSTSSSGGSSSGGGISSITGSSAGLNLNPLDGFGIPGMIGDAAKKDVARIAVTGVLLAGGVALVAAGGWRAVAPTVKPKLDEAKTAAAVAAA